MGIQKYRLKEISDRRQRAVELYRTGLSYVQVGKLMGKSHQWVKLAVDLLDKPDLNPQELDKVS